MTEWIGRHPDMRAAIMEHASYLIEADLVGDDDAPVAEDALARGRSVTIDLLHRARLPSEEAPEAANDVSLIDLLEATGKTLPALAREIGAGRPMLTDYVSGSMAPPSALADGRHVEGPRRDGGGGRGGLHRHPGQARRRARQGGRAARGPAP